MTIIHLYFIVAFFLCWIAFNLWFNHTLSFPWWQIIHLTEYFTCTTNKTYMLILNLLTFSLKYRNNMLVLFHVCCHAYKIYDIKTILSLISIFFYSLMLTYTWMTRWQFSWKTKSIQNFCLKFKMFLLYKNAKWKISLNKISCILQKRNF